MVTTIMVVTVAVFVLNQALQVFFPGLGGPGRDFFSHWFALSGAAFRELKVWTILSYGLLHDPGVKYIFFIPVPFAHLVLNMAGLYFLGRPVEAMIGRNRFLALYVAAVFAGGLVFLAVNFNGPFPVVGASAGVLAIVTVFCMLEPNRQLILFPIPIPVKSRWVLWGILAFSLFGLSGEFSGSVGGVAHSAHLGGMLAGFLFVQFVHRAQPRFGGNAEVRPSVELPDWFKRKKQKPAVGKVNYTVNRSSSRDELQKEVDRILDKINTTGFGSLNDSEKQTLDHAKDILR